VTWVTFIEKIVGINKKVNINYTQEIEGGEKER